MKTILIHKYARPEVLTYDDVPLPEPKVGEARVKIDAIGLNYIDIYQRTGLYPLQTPFTVGMEGAGVVDVVGDGVSEIEKGDRVAYAMILGSYAEYAIVSDLNPSALAFPSRFPIPG
jgi:NADPH2:quinone reductase